MVKQSGTGICCPLGRKCESWAEAIAITATTGNKARTNGDLMQGVLSLDLNFRSYYKTFQNACPHRDPFLFAKLDDILRIHCVISSAAFGVEELQKLLQRFRVSRVPQKGAFAAHLHKFLILEFL
jgi:hypothetical protein